MGDGFAVHLEDAADHNAAYRRVLFTGPNAQLVLMALRPGEDIGLEVHEGLDQFIRIDDGSGEALIGESHYLVQRGDAIVVPQNTRHNVTAFDSGIRLSTIYTKPNHPDGQVQQEKENDEHQERTVRKSFGDNKEKTLREMIVLKPSEYVLLKSGRVGLDELLKGGMPKKGTALRTKKEWKTAHRTPPKEYGEVKYADPEGHRYPIDTAEHVRAALRYFGKPKNYGMYPSKKRKEMLARMHRAAKKFGISAGTPTKGEE